MVNGSPPHEPRGASLHIESDDFLKHPAAEVYPLVRDRLPELLPYLPDVASIAQQSYARESETRVRIVNRWTARAKLPAAAMKFLPPEVLSWTDRALWKDDAYCVDYMLVGFGYEVHGINSFTPHEGGTLLRVVADVTIKPEQLKIPRLVFKRVFPMVEGVVKQAVQPNLTALARGLRDYYATRG